MSDKPKISKIQMIVRVMLFAVLGLAIIALVIDRRARTLSRAAFELVSELATPKRLSPTKAAVQSQLGREPTQSKQRYGGLIDEYHYAGGLPGRSYRVLVAYVSGNDGQMRYVEHYLNEIDDEAHLEELMKSHALYHSRHRGGSFIERIMSNDVDGNGKLTLDELPEEHWQRWLQQGDSNGDGALNRGELEVILAQIRARGGVRRGAGAMEAGAPDDGSSGRPQRPASE